MKAYVLLFVLFCAKAMAAAGTEVITFDLDCDGRTFACTDFMQVMFGGPTQHFIVVRESLAEFKDLRVHSESKPYQPSVPYLSVSKVTFPLSQIGVYLVKKDGDRIVVEFLRSGLPKKQDRKSLEEFICQSLKRPNKPLQPTPGSVTPRAAEGISK